MIKKKRKNPYNNNYSIEYLKYLKNINNISEINSIIYDVISIISMWTNGIWMSTNEFKKFWLDKFLLLRLALQPYISKKSKIIYRSIPLERDQYGYYCSLDVQNSYFRTAIKPLQNWTYNKEFAESWGSGYKYSNKYIQVIFEASTRDNYDNIVFEPDAVLIYFSKIAKLFPEIYNKYKKEINFQIYYLNDRAKELLLYSIDGEIFINNMYVLGC